MQLNGLSNFYLPRSKLKVPGGGSGGSSSSSTSKSTPSGGYYTPVSTTKTYIHGVNVLGTCLTVVLKSGKVSAHIGGMQIWDNAAAADGYTIDYNPTVGSIAQTDAGYTVM